ncbi:exopolyphosphatase prune [Anticarsia gemmatalis]|uniref:exopolyphosphatase prune n=1 Tax=Anticarsia gemmatalis TaxID=129554 RepID=UPI003F7771D5
MDEYFNSSLSKLNTDNYKDLTIVIGNESCDLDSAVSAIVYACFLNWQYNQIQCKVCTRENRPEFVKHDIFLPVLNVERGDYELKTEVAYLFRKYNIFESSLIFRDDHDLTVLTTRPNTKVVLVDHHVLAKKDLFLTPLVTEIIDHRPIDKSSWHYAADTRTTIETVGSCATLVAQRIKNLAALVAKDVDFFNAYLVCSQLLHATIILDTVNFCKQVNKATPHDEEIIQFLESLLQPADYKQERGRVLDELVAARSDVSALSAAQLLKKDVKVVGNVLIPSFPLLVKEFLKKPDASKSVSEALSRHGCSTALLLGMDLSEGLQRDAAVYSDNSQDAAISLSKHLEQWSSGSLGLTSAECGAQHFTYFAQRNLAASRKQYIPAVNAFIQ